MWTSAGYLYDQELCNRHTIELLDICACEEFDQWNSLDAVGWTVLHKAAAFGRAKDIKRLMNLGASTQVHNYNMRWQPIHCAVFHGNENTFDILADAIPAKHLAQLTDAQGWTLLHLAAEHGSEAMMTNLLKRGLDSLFMSNQSSLRVPAGLENREITPRDIARACGHEQAFDRALRAAVDA
jgi:ankyrin repeat protein